MVCNSRMFCPFFPITTDMALSVTGISAKCPFRAKATVSIPVVRDKNGWSSGFRTSMGEMSFVRCRKYRMQSDGLWGKGAFRLVLINNECDVFALLCVVRQNEPTQQTNVRNKNRTQACDRFQGPITLRNRCASSDEPKCRLLFIQHQSTMALFLDLP